MKKSKLEIYFKVCPKCGEVKSVIDFDRSNKEGDGYYYCCKSCKRRNRRLKNKKPKIKVSQKNCNHCKELKPISEFYKNIDSKDGYASWCKKCFNEKLKEYRQTKKYKNFVHSDRQKRYRKKYYQEYREKKLKN